MPEQTTTQNNQYICYNGPLENDDKHGHIKFKIGVSGAAETGHCGLNALDKAKELGREIIRQGAIVLTGATTGFPLWAAMGAKEERGVVIGFSPASNEREHVETYRLPVDYADLIVYTGFGYPGRDLLLTRACDGLVVGCGRIGTIHEFTIAFEDQKPIGILEGPWVTGDEFRRIVEESNRPADHVIFDDDPKRLVEKVIQKIEAYKEKTKAESHYT
ncbi:MAG TPA: hypothetical protein VG982_00655 [Candidatus Paceibacterota bacterium]|nr:hypothetical protein [Candidatus Paceibacterota bacterium]